MKEFGIIVDIVGDGFMLNDLIFMVEELGIRKFVWFLGEKLYDWVSENLIYYLVFIVLFCIVENGDRDIGLLVLKEVMVFGLFVFIIILMGVNEIVIF